MDELEGGILGSVPPGVLSLTLARSTIRMEHSSTWRIDKTNAAHDLVICLEGAGRYRIGEETLVLRPGEAMLIPPETRFTGRTDGPGLYRGIAQHFTLNIYNEHDFLKQMVLRPKVRLSRWHLLEPMLRHYRASAPPGSVTLQQHHMFMYLLIRYVEDAFVSWQEHTPYPSGGADGLNLAVMKAVTTISAHPLDPGIVETAIAAAPYNRDYFLREFQKRVGRTPRKYWEVQRMERAMHLLEAGLNVSATAAAVGYSDPYYFSRMFKRVVGVSPREKLECLRRARHGSGQVHAED
ncbi:AraC family transcriptional regulator [Falsirhodobacter deserti]|uniref:AraC family transcriptional regulator n=1 Tax=Falsirhodobacter deserti TaxID=1365611 RepID=UPI000FE4132C|nr:AraC family transcriptional regulator [Falsirhodobacter deserti]